MGIYDVKVEEEVLFCQRLAYFGFKMGLGLLLKIDRDGQTKS